MVTRKTRGQKRLATITYGQLAEWTGLAEGSIRNAVHQGRMDAKSLDSILRWVNERREKAGLPMIGDHTQPIPETDTPDNVESPTDATNDVQNPLNPDTLQRNESEGDSRPAHHPSCRCNDCWEASKAKRASTSHD